MILTRMLYLIDVDDLGHAVFQSRDDVLTVTMTPVGWMEVEHTLQLRAWLDDDGLVLEVPR